MAVTTTQGHPEILEELYALKRETAALRAELAFLCEWTHADAVARSQEAHGISYMVRTHHPAGSATDEVINAEAGAPHPQEAIRVMHTAGEVYAERHYAHPAHAAAVRDHFEAQGIPTSHHPL